MPSANALYQPLVFILLFLGYKTVYRTKFRTIRDFEHAYFLPNFDQEPSTRRPKGFGGWVRDIWSFVK